MDGIELDDFEGTDHADPAEVYQAECTLNEVGKLLDSICTPREAEVIRLTKFLNLSFDDAATVMGISVGTAKNLSWRGMKKFEKGMELL